MISPPVRCVFMNAAMRSQRASCRAQRSGMPMSTEPLVSRTVVWYQIRVPVLSVTSEPGADSSVWTHMSCDSSGIGAAAHSEV